MEKGLTLAVVLFMVLVYFPGHALLSIAGRKKSEQTVQASLRYGVLVFTCTMVLLFTAEVAGKSNIFSRFVNSLMELSVATSKPLDIWAFAVVFGISYMFSVVLGLGELLIMVGMPYRRKNSLRIKASDPLRDVFLRYRKARKRPYVRVLLTDGTEIVGECVKYGWNEEESILIRDADNNSHMTWVSLKEAKKVEFTNLIVETDDWKEIERNRRILNEIADGLGDEE